jgi:hypothetical protein
MGGAREGELRNAQLPNPAKALKLRRVYNSPRGLIAPRVVPYIREDDETVNRVANPLNVKLLHRKSRQNQNSYLVLSLLVDERKLRSPNSR